MGNCLCSPRLKGENWKNYLQRNFCPKSRKRKIHDLVELSVDGDDQAFKIAADGIKLSKEELDHFYEERDAVVSEFNEDVIEIEIYEYGYELPSENGKTDINKYKTNVSECSKNSQEVSTIAQCAEPRMQRQNEENCQKQLDKSQDMISVCDLPVDELDEYDDLLNEEPHAAQNTCSTTETTFKIHPEERCEASGISPESAEAQFEYDDDSDWESEEEIIENMSDKDAYENLPKGDCSSDKSSDDFVSGDDIRNIDRNFRDSADGSKREYTTYERQICSAIRILERIAAKGLNTSNSVSSRSESENNVQRQSKSEIKRHKDGALIYQYEITNNKLFSAGNVPDNMIAIDGNTIGFRGHLPKSLKSIGSATKSDSDIIHVKPASPETSFDNCKD